MLLRKRVWFLTAALAAVSASVVFAQGSEPAAVDTTSAITEEAAPVEEPEKAQELPEEALTWADSVEIGDAVICEEVENREPEYVGTAFGRDIELVHCYTVVKGAQDSTTIKHVWYLGDQEMAAVPLTVGKSQRWRTWSSKLILPEWTGPWRVDVVSAHGRTLKSVPFKIE